MQQSMPAFARTSLYLWSNKGFYCAIVLFFSMNVQRVRLTIDQDFQMSKPSEGQRRATHQVRFDSKLL